MNTTPGPNSDGAAAAAAAHERRKSSIGITMTLVYALIYCGFIALNVFAPAVMEARAILGLNLAVFYGISLIVVAVVLALVYNHLCRPGRGGPSNRRPAGRLQAPFPTA